MPKMTIEEQTTRTNENSKPVKLTILTSARIKEVLEELAESGLYAIDAEEVAAELLAAAVRREIIHSGGNW